MQYILTREVALQHAAKVGVHQYRQRSLGYVHDTASEELSRADLRRLNDLLSFLGYASFYFLGTIPGPVSIPVYVPFSLPK